MECKNCGAKISIEDERCPFCGAINEEAAKHVEDMKKYQKDYQHTKRTVMTEARRFNRFTVQLTFIALLACLNLFFYFSAKNAWEIGDRITLHRVSANPAKYEAQLNEFRDQKLYNAYYRYYSNNSMYRVKSLRSYEPATSAAHYHFSCYMAIMYLSESEPPATQYQTREDLINSFSSSLAYLYQSQNPELYRYLDNAFTAENTAFIDGLVEQTEDLMRVYLGFTEEDFSNIRGESQQSILIYLAGRLNTNES